MDRGFYLRILDLERAAEWTAILGSDRIPILAPWPTPAELPGRGVCWVYLLDWRSLDPDVLRRVVEPLASRFGLSLDEADAELRAHGLPILEDNTEVVATRGLDEEIDVDPAVHRETLALIREGLGRMRGRQQ